MLKRKLAAVTFILLSGMTLPVAAQSPSVAASPAMLAHGAALRPAPESPFGTGDYAGVVAARGQRHQGTVLMIVGVAGIVTGLIIEEDIVTIAGAVVGGIGLYMFLDSGGTVAVGARRSIPIGF